MKTLPRFVVVAMLLGAGGIYGLAETLFTPATVEGLVAVDPNVVIPSDLSLGANEIVKLHRNGIAPDVITNYVKNYPAKFQLTANQIIYLHNLGVPSDVIAAMVQRDHQLQPKSMVQTQTYQTPAQQPLQASTPVPPPAPPYAQPAYYYSYPYYYPYYPYYYPGYFYGPSISFGFGFGFGNGDHHHGGHHH